MFVARELRPLCLRPPPAGYKHIADSRKRLKDIATFQLVTGAMLAMLLLPRPQLWMQASAIAALAAPVLLLAALRSTKPWARTAMAVYCYLVLAAALGATVALQKVALGATPKGRPLNTRGSRVALYAAAGFAVASAAMGARLAHQVLKLSRT